MVFRLGSILKILLINEFLNFQQSSALFSSFGRERDLPKCCGPDEAVYVQEARIVCRSLKDFPWRTRYVVSNFSSDSFFETCVHSEECIDYQVKDDKSELPIKYTCGKEITALKAVEHDVLPKCCNPRHSYDTYFGACRADDDNILKTDELFHVHVGLSNCQTVVTDHVIESYNEVKSKSELSIEWLGEVYPWGSYCFDRKHGSNKYILKVCEKSFEKCKYAPFEDGLQCIRKCCPVGQNFLPDKKCGTHAGLEIQGYDFHNKSRVQLTDNVAFIHGINCKKYLAKEETYNYTLDEAGTMHLFLNSGLKLLPGTLENYCYERAVLNDNLYKDYVFFCVDQHPLDDLRLKIISVILCVSVACLFITFLGYLILPDMQNLHGRTLMVHCFCLMVACAFLAYAQFNPVVQPLVLCKTIGYFILFWFLAAFTWLNIMCFDIWWTFGSMRVQGIGQRQRELKRFLYYNVYGWGFPLFFTVFAICAQNYDFLPKKFTPDVGKYNCFFSRGNFEAHALFFLLPVAFLTVCNCVLFGRTTYYCYKVKSEVAKIKDSSKSSKEKKRIFNADRERLTVIFKLFVIMGISWIFESISGCFPYRKSVFVSVLEIIVDSYNASEGILIFCVFMLKKKVWKNVQKKFGIIKTRKISSQTNTNTSSLHSSSLQNYSSKNNIGQN